MAVIFESIGTYKTGIASDSSILSKKQRGTIRLTKTELSFNSERDHILFHIDVLDIENLYIKHSYKAPIIRLKSIYNVFFSMCPLKKKDNSFKTSIHKSEELLTVLTRLIFEQNQQIIFESKGFFCLGFPPGRSWRSAMQRGLILLSEEYLSFKAINQEIYHQLPILHIQSIQKSSKGSTSIIKVQTFQDYFYSYVTAKKQKNNVVGDQSKTEEFYKTLKNIKLNASSAVKREETYHIDQVKIIESMIKVSTRIKLEMMRDVLKMEKESFNEKIFDWAKRFDFIIDGNYLVVKHAKVSEFIRNLNKDYDFSTKKSKKKKTTDEKYCFYCKNVINKEVKICPYCGIEQN